VTADPRIAVIIPCYGDGELLPEAVHSIDEPEPVEIVVVDDGSTDALTHQALERLEREGFHVVRHETNLGVSQARMTGMRETTARYLFPLDADDLAISGVLSTMADRLDAEPDAAVCLGDYVEFGEHELVRAVPETLDPYRVAYTNEYPPSALMRRDAVVTAGGWKRLTDQLDARSDWSLWMGLAEQGGRAIHLGPGRFTYAHRFHGPRLAAAGRAFHRELYRELRRQHPGLFGHLAAHRRNSSLGRLRKLLYPVVYGGRPRWSAAEPRLKAVLDRLGVWTLTRSMSSAQREVLAQVLLGARRAATRPGRPPVESPRVAVIVPCYNDGAFVREAVRSIDEPEPVEIVIVDDGSTDELTRRELEQLEHEGLQLIRHETNRGLAAARTTGLSRTKAPYVFPLDSDDLAIPGALSAMADRLDAEPNAAVCFGDYVEFGNHELVRAVPAKLDPYRVAYTNEYSVSSLYRRSELESVGGWSLADAHEDWDLWMTLAERGARGIHLGAGVPTFKRRVHSDRLGAQIRARHVAGYRTLRDRHHRLFRTLQEHRRASSMSAPRKLLYPIVYGGRRRLPIESRIKVVFDRLGIWTLRR
jgi:glycosyltransferase involved in cell wall biosynthesis